MKSCVMDWWKQYQSHSRSRSRNILTTKRSTGV